jgi:hypothetical protein
MAFGDPDLTMADQGLEEEVQVAHTMTFILIVIAFPLAYSYPELP